VGEGGEGGESYREGGVGEGGKKGYLLWMLDTPLLEVMAFVVLRLLPSLKFVGLPVRMILRIYCVSINRPSDLDLLISKLVHGLLV